MKITGYVLIALGAAFILAGMTLLALGGGPINFVTTFCGGFIVGCGVAVVQNAKIIEEINKY